MWESWNEIYRNTLGQSERSLVSELRDIRTRWAHQEVFSSDDAYRALDSTHRLLLAVSSPDAGQIEGMKMELLRVRFDEQARTQRRRTASAVVESQGTSGLAPWREGGQSASGCGQRQVSGRQSLRPTSGRCILARDHPNTLTPRNSSAGPT